MTFGHGDLRILRKAKYGDIPLIKRLADQHRNELGFVLRPALEKSIKDEEVIVAEFGGQIVAFVHYHHRRDLITTIYHVAVSQGSRTTGLGRAMINALVDEVRSRKGLEIRLKCPVELDANAFYEKCGFELLSVLEGKNRRLNFWSLPVC